MRCAILFPQFFSQQMVFSVPSGSRDQVPDSISRKCCYNADKAQITSLSNSLVNPFSWNPRHRRSSSIALTLSCCVLSIRKELWMILCVFWSPAQSSTLTRSQLVSSISISRRDWFKFSFKNPWPDNSHKLTGWKHGNANVCCRLYRNLIRASSSYLPMLSSLWHLLKRQSRCTR